MSKNEEIGHLWVRLTDFICTVNQLVPKIRLKVKKCAIQNGRPGRSLKSKETQKDRKKDPRTQKSTEKTDTEPRTVED